MLYRKAVMIMLLRNKNKIKGNDNISNQIGTQNIYYQQPIYNDNKKYSPDERAIKILKETIEDEKSEYIIYVKTLSGRTIQCGNRFSVNSEELGEREMTYWEDSFENLLRYGFIGDVGTKGEVFKILKNGYEFYDANIKSEEEIKKNNNLKLNDIHIKILKMFRDSDYTLWDNQLSRFFKDNIDNEIAFNELLKNDYIERGLVFTSDGGCYNVNYLRKMEILKILKEYDINN